MPRSTIFPRFDHQNLIGAANGGEPVRDDERRAPAHQLREAFLNQHFGFGIEARSRFVQNQDARVGQNRARDRNALALPAGKFHAALADDRVVRFRKTLGEFVHARDPARRQNFFLARVGPRKRHVLANRAVKQERLLQHDAEPRAVGIEPHRGQVHAVHQHAAPRAARETPRQVR